MYVCMYVSACACALVCVNACMYVCTYVRKDVCIYVFMYLCACVRAHIIERRREKKEEEIFLKKKISESEHSSPLLCVCFVWCRDSYRRRVCMVMDIPRTI